MNTLLLSVYLYFKNLFDEEEGQDLIEYALIIALFVIVAVVALSSLNAPLAKLWSNIGKELKVAK